MSKITKKLLLHWIPPLLGMNPHKSAKKRAKTNDEEQSSPTVTVQIQRAASSRLGRKSRGSISRIGLSRELCRDLARAPVDERLRKLYYTPVVIKTLENIEFISQLLKKEMADGEVGFES
jgi:hypothetical protein